jgi:hypothetical protein
MTAPDASPSKPKPPFPFAGSDDELEKYLLEFSRLVGGWIARQPPGPAWVLSSGARLSTNPNTIPWKARVSRQGDGIMIETRPGALVGRDAKVGRIAAYREGQLVDYLTARVRGLGPEKFDARRLREPFAPFGEGVAALTASFAWSVATGLATFAVAYACTVLASLPLLNASIREIAAHSAALLQAGAIPLPSPAEAAAAGALGAAIVFAFPIAFLAALVHVAALTACDLGFRTARVPQAAFLFVAILLVFALFPFFSVLSVPMALAVPLGAHAGALLVWRRRRERVREGGRPKKAVVLIGVMLAASLAGAAVPRATEWKEAMNRIALFRDRFLLDNAAGKAVAAAYYKFTLYGAEPLKELYAGDGDRASRSQPIAACADPAVAIRLRALHFVVVSSPAGSDVVVGPGGIDPGRDLAELKGALDQFSRRTFRGGPLRELSTYAWRSLYYLGPLVVLLLLMGLLAPAVSILFRKLPPRMAVFGLAACAIVTSLSLIAVEPEARPELDLGQELLDPSPAVRHEAAFRAGRLAETSGIAEPLLKTADDPDLRVRLWACAALGKSKDPRALPKLLERLEDSEFLVRYRAAEGLGFLKDPKAVDALQRVMRERSWYEGVYALDALRRIQPERY